MTREPIMIDDVNVAECIYYADSKCTNSQMIQGNCKNVTVCYYKEYKRKEQECEELKEYKASKQASYETMQIEWNEAKNEVKQLKKENEQLKKSVRSNKDKRKRAIERYLKLKDFTNKEFQELKAENKELNKQNFILEKQHEEDLKAFATLNYNRGNDILISLSIKKKMEAYQLALQEIKEIALSVTGYFPDGEIFARPEIEQILQKCEALE